MEKNTILYMLKHTTSERSRQKRHSLVKLPSSAFKKNHSSFILSLISLPYIPLLFLYR